MQIIAILLLLPPPPVAVWPISRLWSLHCSSSSHSYLLQLCVSFFCCIIWWHHSTFIFLIYSLAFQHAFFLHDFFPECFGILFSNILTSFSIHLHYQVHVFMEHVPICTVPYSPDAINPYCSKYSLKEYPLEETNTLCSTLWKYVCITPIQNSWLNECFVLLPSPVSLIWMGLKFM